MPRLLIISHTPSENTTAMTAAVARGASHPDFSAIEVQVKQPLNTTAKDVMAANGLILGTTENFGYMSGAMKDFFDRIFYSCLDQTESLPYALFIRAGNDGQGALSSVERIVAGLCWKQVQQPLICRGPWDADFPVRCEELGMTMSAGLDAGIF